METPSTRSRRKRELGSSQEEGISIAWVHDQGLRRAVLLATENDHLELPTPTQKPRPISSLLSPSTASSTLPTSSRPPRKRPCRNHRSLPLSTNRSYSPGTFNRTNSLPLTSGTRTQEGPSKLDSLLDEISKFGLGGCPSSGHGETQGGRRQASTPASSSRTVPQPASAKALQPTSANARTDHPRHHKSSTPRKLTESPIRAKLPQPPKLVSPTKTGAPPRIGLRSNCPKPSSQKPFRPPLLADQAVRSSPHRAAQTPPIRGPAQTSARSDVSKTNTEPSSDGLADESFDSLDGMFQDGGPEIEELLRKVDGSQ